MIEVSPGFGVLVVAAATVVVAPPEPTRPRVVAQKPAHSSDRRLLEGISENILVLVRWYQDGINC